MNRQPDPSDPSSNRTAVWLGSISTLATLVGIALGLLGERWGAPAPAIWSGWTIAYLAGGWLGSWNAFRELGQARVDIDLLMVLAALGALWIGAPMEGAVLLFLFTLSNLLQEIATGRSRDAIRTLVKLRPEQATLRTPAGTRVVSISEVAVGDIYLVGPGDRLPLDGRVITGRSEVDQAAITGESVPVSRGPGDGVLAGTINGEGALDVRVEKRSDDSTIARMIALVEEAREEKAATQRIVDRLEQPYALGVIGLTLLAIVVPVFLSLETLDAAVYRAMTLMVAASPCALVISTPSAVLSGIAAGARNGVLFKGGIAIEQLATARAFAFDKTGTLTQGATELVEIVPSAGVDEHTLLSTAAAVQARSEHHLARATLRAAQSRGIAPLEGTDFEASVGRGVTARVGGADVRVGNPAYFEDLDLPIQLRSTASRLQREGRTAVIVTENRNGAVRHLGVLGFADSLRPGADRALRLLRRSGVARIVMLTGDNAGVATRLAGEVGVDEGYSELLPAQKVDQVRALAATWGSVVMVGDGVNDAPALAAATVGIAMGAAGTDVALETADVVLMSDDLNALPWAFELSRRTRRTLSTNIALSLAVILLMVGFILTAGLPLPLAVIGHEGSTVVVALNGLRLLRAPPLHGTG